MTTIPAKSWFATLIIILVSAAGCQQNTYDGMRTYIDEIKVIDTHEHQGLPWKHQHNCFDMGLYLHADLISAGMEEYPDSMEQIHDSEAYWEHTEPYLRFCRGTSYYAQFINNYKQLYGFKGDELTREDFLWLSDQTDLNFRNYPRWLDSVCRKSNIQLMLTDQVWAPFNPNTGSDYFRYVFRIDQLVLDAALSARQQQILNIAALELLGREAYKITGLDSYIAYVDDVLEKVVQNNVVCLKVGLAYHRYLDFSEVETETAERIFNSRDLSDKETKLLQDYVFNHIMDRAVAYGLPIQIHTGYRHGNSSMLDTGEPMQLLTLFKRYPHARLVLFHGAYPWTGEFIVLGKSFPNIYLDLVWLPQLSRTAAIRTLHEMLDAVPYNKICWGGDVGYIDDAAGSLEIAREVVATVLSERIDRGWITREVAEDIALRIFRENAIDIYNLDL